jgi:hypothetical protein
MEPKIKLLITLFLAVFLNSCRPDHNAFVLNKTKFDIFLETRKGKSNIFPNGEIAFDEIKDLDRIILKVSSQKIDLGNVLRELSLKYLQACSVEVGEPHHLLVVVKEDGFIYLGYRTVDKGKSGFFRRQPDKFPYKWN